MKKLLILFISLILLAGCDSPFAKSPFERGDKIVIKSTGEKGTVNAVSRRSGDYRVKVDGSNKWVHGSEIAKDTGQTK